MPIVHLTNDVYMWHDRELKHRCNFRIDLERASRGEYVFVYFWFGMITVQYDNGRLSKYNGYCADRTAFLIDLSEFIGKRVDDGVVSWAFRGVGQYVLKAHV